MAKNIDFHIANLLSIWNCITQVSVCISISKYGIPYHKNTKRKYCRQLSVINQLSDSCQLSVSCQLYFSCQPDISQLSAVCQLSGFLLTLLCQSASQTWPVQWGRRSLSNLDEGSLSQMAGVCQLSAVQCQLSDFSCQILSFRYQLSVSQTWSVGKGVFQAFKNSLNMQYKTIISKLNKGRHGTDPWPTESKIIPFAS